ncbi:thioredoxin reductase [Candidatus Woesebacteria bacterium]|nr:thioredoxin reductase [Candidatus Woesebacteria bacterium]
MHDVIIIGGGAAGLGAALYCARYNLKTLLIAKEFGGTGNIAHQVDNWIGEPGISGMKLMQKFIKHVDSYKVQRLTEEVKSITKNSEGTFSVKAEKTHKTKTIIYALGMTHRKLGIPGEEEYASKGVHYCYTCDGILYKDKTVAVVGGSDAAALGALFLGQHAKQVYVLYRKDKLRAEPISSKQVYEHPKIKVIHNVNVTEFKGEAMLKSITLDNGKTMDLDGVFIEIGHIPLSNLAKEVKVKINDHGFIEVDQTQTTNVKGFFAAGDITTAHTLKQFITSAAEGSVAAESVYRYLTKENNK